MVAFDTLGATAFNCHAAPGHTLLVAKVWPRHNQILRFVIFRFATRSAGGELCKK
jgi:hypothetical protein